MCGRSHRHLVRKEIFSDTCFFYGKVFNPLLRETSENAIFIRAQKVKARSPVVGVCMNDAKLWECCSEYSGRKQTAPDNRISESILKYNAALQDNRLNSATIDAENNRINSF